MYRIILTILVLLTAIQSQSQFLRADYRKADIMFHRPVIVALFDLTEASDSCELTHMLWYNENIVDLMREHWALNDSIMTMDPKRFRSVIGSKSPEYAVFAANLSREGQQSSNDVFWYRSFTFMLYLSEDGMRIDPEIVDRNSPLIPDSDNSGHLLRGRYIFKLSMVNFQLSKYDITFVISQFNSKVQEALEKRYAKKGLYGEKVPGALTSSLKNKTLLIPDDLFDDVDHDEAVIQYKHPYRVVSQEELQSAISSCEENAAYFHYFWSDQERMFLGGVIDIQTGNVLAMLKPGAASLKHSECLQAGSSYRTLIRMRAKQLKRLSRSIN